MNELKIHTRASTKQLMSSSKNKIVIIECTIEIAHFCSLLCIINVFLGHLAKTVIIVKCFGLLIRLIINFEMDSLFC
jgi:hypothetical protein